jgi:hypothetical protein
MAATRDNDAGCDLLERRPAEQPRRASRILDERGTRPAAFDVMVQHRGLELGEFAVELSRRPRPGALTGSTHGSHV